MLSRAVRRDRREQLCCHWRELFFSAEDFVEQPLPTCAPGRSKQLKLKGGYSAFAFAQILRLPNVAERTCV